MFATSRPLGLAALFIFASAALHVLAPLVGGFSGLPLMLVAVGILYAAIGYLLLGNRRWLAWLTFLLMLAGGIVSLVSTTGAGAVPGWWWTLIMIADWAAAAMLFAYLWLPKPAAP
ncbi:hypothetical protein [uncultured Hoeflea sp.]|uniref:hypothetical protein n=1 Tax=uncultured Hoeflea sp. TaxID=538666 RepID=UPI0026372A84|nr:hypothetical protein [uncultured Hoeflea sp.]